jgi:hypothetical protein
VRLRGFTVTALDGSNTQVTGYGDPVHFTSTDSSSILPADVLLTNGTGTFTVSLADLFSPSLNGVSASITVSPASGLRYIPVTPCRVVDTWNAAGQFGGPQITAGGSRDFTIPNGACGIPSMPQAYSLKFAVAPVSTLGFLTLWPAGLARPLVATLNSVDGRIKSNAAIVATGAEGGRQRLRYKQCGRHHGYQRIFRVSCNL